MQKIIRLALVLVAVGMLSIPVLANSISLNVDSAPNVYGSPNWGSWWTETKTDVVGGSFKNMRTGTYPGTLVAHPLDMIVYSTGDLGKRLHWIYSIPDRSVADLTQSGDFQIRLIIDWDGAEWALDFGSGGWYDQTELDKGWDTPGSWEDYNGGTIGSFGLAWWATDNDAPPYSTYGNAYDETNAADIQTWVDTLFQYQDYARGEIRYRDNPNAEWQVTSLQVATVPEPSTIMLLGLGIAGIAAVKIRRK